MTHIEFTDEQVEAAIEAHKLAGNNLVSPDGMRAALTAAAEIDYEYVILNGLGRALYYASTYAEARASIVKEQAVGPRERVPSRMVMRRRRAGEWEPVTLTQ